MRNYLYHTICLFLLPIMVIWGCSERPIDFNAEIRPILNTKCISCHGGVKQSGGFGLVFRENALAKTANDKWGIVPGKPAKSELIRRIQHSDPEIRMPLEADPLSEKEIELLTTWIEQGAEWEEHWAYLKPSEPEIPELETDWGNNQIDRFILQKIEEKGLIPSEEADKYSLLRRVSLDLIGVPPTPEQLDQFINDPSDASYEKLVDQLLASPKFGEHWATMWLDLARYADSRGYEKDSYRSIWKYRDWVIKALNEDKPFDEFTIEQLAGDLLPEPTKDQLIATGFHRNTLNNDEGGTFNEEYRIAQVIDRVNTTWEVWQATTMACVQCHSHPYDPIKMEDFYQSMSFFNNSADWDVNTEYPVLREFKPEDEEKLNELKTWIKKYGAQDQAKKLEKVIQTTAPRIGHEDYDEVENVVHQNRGDEDFMEVYDGSVLTMKEIDLSGKDRLLLFYKQGGKSARVAVYADGEEIGNAEMTTSRQFSRLLVPMEPGEGVVTMELRFFSEMDNYRGNIDGIILLDRLPGADQPEYPSMIAKMESLLNAEPESTTLIMQEKPERYKRKTNVFVRGNWLDKGDEVEPGVPFVLSEDSTGFSNRLDLARWLVSDDNPLTARVMVNRIWAQLFGVGIVETVEDIGTIGDKPTHPELLDWMALRFGHEYKWSIKKLIKTIVMSATYRQSSKVNEKAREVDPDNTWLSYSPRVRLSAEQIRDQALAVSGLLSDKMYGPSVMPHQPEGIWNVVYSGDKWVTSEGEDAYRRGLYTYIRRSGSYPSLLTFDASSRQVCVSRRINTNTPLQALVTLNDPVYMEAARHLAQKVRKSGLMGQELIQEAYQQVMCRPPSQEKLLLLSDMFEEMKKHYTGNEKEMLELIDQVNPELAALTVVANVLLNMDEFIVKS